MNRQQLIQELNLLKIAFDDWTSERKNWDVNDPEPHMSNKPTAPLEPKKPVKPDIPKNEKDRFLQLKQMPTESDCKVVVQPSVGGKVGSIILMVVGIVIASSALIEFISAIISRNIFFICYSLFQFSAGAVAFIFSFVIRSKLPQIAEQKSKDESLKNYQEKQAEVVKYNASAQLLIDKALADYDTYEKEMNVYTQNYALYKSLSSQYRKDLAMYQQAYNQEKIKAVQDIKSHNQAADTKFKSVVSTSVAFPEKYYSALDAIINIVKDMRADSVKEAIEVYVNDEYRKQSLEIQRQAEENKMQELEYQLKQQERAQREQDRKNEEEESAARRQCWHCKNEFSCPMSGKIKTVCPNFRAR